MYLQEEKRQQVPVTDLIKQVAENMADEYLQQAAPVLAAACHLAIGDPVVCVFLCLACPFYLCVDLPSSLTCLFCVDSELLRS